MDHNRRPSTALDRRQFGAAALSAAGVLALSACSPDPAPPGRSRATASPTSASTRIRDIRIPTAAGTFDAVAAGRPDGRKVLLLHGNPELGIEWTAQLHRLAAAGYHAVAPDQRGYSPGVRPTAIAAYQLDHPVRDVTAMADALGWSRFDLVGHDWGAAVAWIAAARYAARIRSLTAVSVPHLGAFGHALRTDPQQQRASRYMARFRAPSPGPERQILAGGPPRLPGVPADRCRAYFARLSQPGALTASLNWYRANDFQGYRQHVRVPTLYTIGDRDQTVAPSAVRATAQWVDGPYRLRILRGVDHFAPEQAADAVSDLLLGHLARS